MFNVLKLIMIMIFLITPYLAWSQITFEEIKWESTFNCPYWEHDGIATWMDPKCDGLMSRGSMVDGHMTMITSDANYPEGGGSKGARFWKISGGDNIQTAQLRIIFPHQVPEFWLRFYIRYEEGFQWNGVIDSKLMYYNATIGASGTLGLISNDQIRIVNQDGQRIDDGKGGTFLDVLNSPLGYGWNSMYPGGISDGSWHCLEFYLKMDSGLDNFDGVAAMWFNGKLAGYKNDMNFSSGAIKNDYPDVLNGWSWIDIKSNQKDPGLDRPYYCDIDDVVMYTQKPPNLDIHGNPFIGPIGWSNTVPLAIYPPMNLRVIED